MGGYRRRKHVFVFRFIVGREFVRQLVIGQIFGRLVIRFIVGNVIWLVRQFILGLVIRLVGQQRIIGRFILVRPAFDLCSDYRRRQLQCRGRHDRR